MANERVFWVSSRQISKTNSKSSATSQNLKTKHWFWVGCYYLQGNKSLVGWTHHNQKAPGKTPGKMPNKPTKTHYQAQENLHEIPHIDWEFTIKPTMVDKKTPSPFYYPSVVSKQRTLCWVQTQDTYQMSVWTCGEFTSYYEPTWCRVTSSFSFILLLGTFP